MAIITKDSDWIYNTLAEAFTRETGKEWQSYSRIQLRHILSELDDSEETGKWKLLFEIDSIEFEVEDEE